MPKRCEAIKSDGSSCGGWAMRGKPHCRVHGGVSRERFHRIQVEVARAEIGWPSATSKRSSCARSVTCIKGGFPRRRRGRSRALQIPC